MRKVTLTHPADYDGWRCAARAAWQDGLRAGDVLWCTDDATSDDLFAESSPPDVGGERGVSPRQTLPASCNLVVPRAFVQLARLVVCHRDRERFALLYGLLLRLQSDRKCLRRAADPLVKRLSDMAKSVRRDAHKMTAFVRFRKVGHSETGRERFVAWFEPTHHIVRHCAPFFVQRFASMDWCILCPDDCVRWDGQEMTFFAGSVRPSTVDDDMEDIWCSYYASIFNPARLKTSAMQSEMPKKYWKNLPEAHLIPELVRQARTREREMMMAEPTEPLPGMMVHKERVVTSASGADADEDACA